MTSAFTSEEIRDRTSQVDTTLRCPHCDGSLEKWQVPDTPFVEWSSEFQYICFNDQCPYFEAGWRVMESIGNACSYRFMYDPSSGGCHPIPVPTKESLREHIVQTAQAAND